MTDLFAARPASQPRLVIERSYLRGAIWIAAIAFLVLLPRPDYAEQPRHIAEIVSR